VHTADELMARITAERLDAYYCKTAAGRATVRVMSSGHQLDLFAARGIAATSPASEWEPPRRLAPSQLDDAALIAAIPYVRQADCSAVTAEAVRRGLISAVPAFEALCRRFKGVGLTHRVPEQVAAVKALAALGSREASAALVRILCDDVMQGPGLAEAVGAAAALRARLPAERGIALLRHAEPAVRAEACRCVPPHPSVVAILVDLLGDVHPTIATAAACALGHFGHREARPILGQLLREEPTEDVIAAVVAIADADLVVQLRRIARARPDLTVAVKAAIEDIDDPLAGAVFATLSSHASDTHRP
jgi:hypothetical protein